MTAISHPCRRAYEVATRKVLKQAPQEQDNHVLFVGHGEDTKDAGEEFQQFLHAGKAGLLVQKKTQTREILELFFYFLEYDRCSRPLEDRIKKPMAPSDDAELSEADNPVPNDDGTESEIADNDEIAAVGNEQNEGATLHTSQTSASTSRNSTAGTRSSEGQGNFVTLSTLDASAPVDAVCDLLSKGVSDGLNASVHSLSYADAAELLLWLESHPPEDISGRCREGSRSDITVVSVTRFLLGLNATEAPPAEMLSDIRSLKAAIQTRRRFNEKQASLFARRAERAQQGRGSRGNAGWQGFSWIVEITSWGAEYMKNLQHQAFQEVPENRWVPWPEDLEQKPDEAEMDRRFNEFNRKLEEKNKDFERKLADSKRELEQKFEGQKKEMAEFQLWRQQIMAALISFPGIQPAGLQN
ncbi:hypothetical protein BDZ91DRAFT_829718 [Kalaharituber pfeilii]|nr:hypothetical protein BDZ91DRAFT_829718 [Kalaharituber pfeilii]